MKSASQRGFTLVELIVASAIVMLLLAVTIILLRPADYSSIRENAKRQTDLAAMAQAVHKYMADKGALPLPTTKIMAISSGSGHYDLCKYLVPQYLKDIPTDPILNIKFKSDNTPTTDACNKDDVIYASGYGIQADKQGRIMLLAPLATGGPLSITISQ